MLVHHRPGRRGGGQRGGEVGVVHQLGVDHPLGDLANEVRYTGTTITLTRHGKPIACLVPVEDTMTIGTRVTV
ncbi:type II toxin-antitoxin system Phd/YefM family antitoxin, partial [Streptomyces sp. A73]|nr:type II toxin-antitoxin system Phd/YefM family antitoxin [Streptomyces sp. A73]